MSSSPLGRLLVTLAAFGVIYAVFFYKPTPSGGAGPASWTPPAGFTAWNNAVAYQWIDHPTCSYSTGSCWGINVVARDGCPSSLYAEVSLTDSNGTVIGFTNDTVGTVGIGQQARLTFDTFKDNASRATLSKISCY